MKKIIVQVNYCTRWGQELRITGSIPELGNWEQEKALNLQYIENSFWQIELLIAKEVKNIAFSFFVTENGHVLEQEFGKCHTASLPPLNTFIHCIWQEKPKQAYFYTSMFENSIFKQKETKQSETKDVQLIVDCVHIAPHQELVLGGSSDGFGKWDEEKALSMHPCGYGKWSIDLRGNDMLQTFYKYAIRDKHTSKIVEWEEGENRTLTSTTQSHTIIEEKYRKSWINWKASGVAIPIFSLRSQKSFGIGEFSNLKLLVDWAAKSKMKVIQTLPINDTTATYSWKDSYPYNAISIYALHPIYIGLHEYPLNDKKAQAEYEKRAERLNKLPCVDYCEVIKLKIEYLKDLFEEVGQATLREKKYIDFYKTNKDWLFPYAAFCYLRDELKTVKISDWKEFWQYDKEKLTKLIDSKTEAKEAIERVYFTQYLLHKQLSDAKEYAYNKGIVLKGDIPIGISPNSVEAWTEPHLFNLDCQTGAPPDDFSVNGQNWGFPTYNWAEMKKDNYDWWTKRFRKMSDYFDAYRIDHILGFFRIWEIPQTSVHGLLGYFSPALPLSVEEIESWGINYSEDMTIASIHHLDGAKVFGVRWDSVCEKYLTCNGEYYTLKQEFDNQKKIEAYFIDKIDTENEEIKEALYEICNEVFFIKDKYQKNKLHPRISIQNTLKYSKLNSKYKEKINALYLHYFYHRHTHLWKEEAMSKLPTLIRSTNMLVCGEDLGMVPESVPSVMSDLQILSLEIQRMPKQLGVRFSNLEELPYLTVCTTSTHDMSPIRLWWKEDADTIQEYFNSRLYMQGVAPKECNTIIATKIIESHLKSPAMLAVLPFQDWLAISDRLRRKEAKEERINEPSNPHHNWNYRMHLELEELLDDKEFGDTLRFLNEECGR